MPLLNLNKNNSRLLLILYYVLPALVLFLLIMAGRSEPPSDWAAYYFGGREVMKFHYPLVYNTYLFNYHIEQLGYKNIFVSYAPFPPYTALITSPFTSFLSLDSSKLVFNIFSSIIFLFTLYRAFRFLSVPRWMLLLLPIIFYIPLRNNIYFGQGYMLLVALLLEGYIAHKKGKTALASFCWGLAILFKVFPAFIVIWLLLRKEFKAIIYLGVALMILVIPSLYFNGLDSWIFYVTKMLPRANNGELNNPFIYIFQSAFMLLKNIFVPDSLFNPHPLFANRWLFIISWIIFRTFVIAGAITATIQKKQDDIVSFSIWVIASMLVSPNGSSYSLILLLIPALSLPLIKLNSPRNPSFLIVAFAIVFLICNIPVYKLVNYPVLLQYPRLYFSIILFLMMLWMGIRKFNYIALLACALLLLLPEIPKLRPDHDNSSYLLSKEEHILIYDYMAAYDKLAYFYRDAKGTHGQLTDISVKELRDSQDIEEIDNQIWYKGKQLTHSPDEKYNPQLLNGQYIIYISDKDRGIGFSTLRKIPVN